MYHLLQNGQQSGPFTVRALQGMLARGEIRAADLVWRSGMTEWQPVGRLVPPPLPVVPAPPPVSSPPVVPSVTRANASSLWMWVGAAVFLLVASVGGLVFYGVRSFRSAGTDERSFRPLFDDRAGHRPAWRESSFEAAGPADEPDGTTFALIRYRSPAGELAAYLTPDPNDGRRHPAVVWAHGGFGGIDGSFWAAASKRDDQSARAFRDKGIVLMCPSWRGENDNPGRFELFYGEVDDLLAAVDHVKSLPYVDPQRVYLAGHSTGGTLVLLAAGASDSFRAAFSFGGQLDGVTALSDDGYGNTPYDPDSVRDHRLRSPMRYAAFMRRPVFYFEGGEYYEESAANDMRRRSAGNFQAFKLPGDHFDILHPTTALLAEKILKDTGETCSIRFTEAELRQRYEAAFAHSLATELARWMGQGGDVEQALGRAEADDIVPRTAADVQAVAAAVAHLARRADVSPETAAGLATLAALRNDIEEEDLFEAFDAQVGEPLVAWVQQRLADPVEVGEKEAEPLFRLLATLAGTRLATAADLVVAAASGGRLPASHDWNGVFETFDDEHPHTARVMKAFAEAPPGGFTGVLLLDAANSLFFDDWKGTHPYNNDQGAALLRQWLEHTNPEQSSHAHSAAFGCAFIDPKFRADLIPVALRHSNRLVRLEGAWADLRTGGSQGLGLLKDACLDVHQSDRAQDYLKELGHEADIPAAAREPGFAAQAALSRWLQHPNELDADPLSLEIYDRRTLHWPPTGDERELWLIRFTYQFSNQPGPKTGYGCVGSMTWSSFEEYAEPPKPEDLYLLHCTLEMRRKSGRREKDAATGEARRRALEALQKANPGRFDGVVVERDANAGRDADEKRTPETAEPGSAADGN